MIKTFNKQILSFMLITVISVLMTACSNDDNDVFGTCEVSGIISDSNGNPIEGATVNVLAADVACSPTETVTDQDGHYILTTKEATASLLIMVVADGFSSHDEVITDIPFQGFTPDVTLGSAKITVDIVLTKN